MKRPLHLQSCHCAEFVGFKSQIRVFVSLKQPKFVKYWTPNWYTRGISAFLQILLKIPLILNGWSVSFIPIMTFWIISSLHFLRNEITFIPWHDWSFSRSTSNLPWILSSLVYVLLQQQILPENYRWNRFLIWRMHATIHLEFTSAKAIQHCILGW